MHTVFDHIVFGASSLEAGAAWLEQQLGVPLAPGGEHVKMGTHNRLLRLGELTYLELIAINAEAPKPPHPRWFGLDAIAPHELNPPRLFTWLARTDDIAAAAANTTVALGPVHNMSRNALSWRVTIPDDGSLAEDGLMPALIEWPPDVHPAKNFPDRGVALKSFKLHTPDTARLEAAFASIGLDMALNGLDIVQGGAKSLEAVLSLPDGREVSFRS